MEKIKIYQIDQSGKVENTSVKTVVAYSNGKHYAIEISGKDKRRLQESFRLIGAPRLFVNLTFASLVCLLVNKRMKEVIIDLEYFGHDKTLTKMIKEYHPHLKIRWEKIGKKSNAHSVANGTYRNKLKVDKKVNAREVWKVATKIAGERLSTRLVTVGRRPVPTTLTDYSKKRKKVK